MMKEMTNLRYPVLFRVLHVILLAGILIEGFGSIFGISNAGMWHWLIAVGFVCLLVFLNYGRARSRLIGGIIIVVCLFVALVFVGFSQMHDFMTNYFDWLIGREGWNAKWCTGYEFMQTLLVVMGCYLFQMLAERYFVLRSVATVIILTGMVISMAFYREISHLSVVLAMGYMVVCYVEGTQRGWRKKRERDTREYVLWLLPFFLLYMALMVLMPAPENPYDWKFVKDTYQKIRENFTVWIETQNRNGQEDFGTAVTGFSEDGRLMSGLLDNNQKLLTIQGSQGLVTNVYLVGKVYDTFDGREWTQTITEDTQERTLDTLETLYAIERYDGERKDNYIYSTGLSIRYEYFDTGCVFAPLKLRYINGCDYLSSGGNLLFEEQRGYGTNYQAVYFQMNLDHPKFYEMAEAELEDDKEVWEKTVGSYGLNDAKRFTLEDLKLHQRNMKESYHQDISISGEAKEYLGEITEEAQTTIQKLIAIEKELSSYTYTKNPGKLPETIDSQEAFLDYFLMESRQGYCSYFATAFVLMARAEGIPARYVQGFCVPVTTDKKMTVTANMAHAWPEVYIEGIGWLPFEPTPGYEEIRYTPWEMREKKEYSGMSIEEEPESIESEEIANVMTEEAHSDEDNRFLWMILSGVLAVLIACAMVLLADQWLFRRRYERMTVEERFLAEVRKNLWLLSRLGYKRKDTETLEELQNRVLSGLPQAFPVRTELVFLRGYEEYLYRRKEVQEETLRAAVIERRELMQWIKEEKRLYFYTLAVRVRFVR